MDVFTELSLIIVIAAVVAGIMRLLRQPLIIGYVITGLVVGPYLLNIVSSKSTLDVFSELGIAFLLFIVGLSMSPKVIKEVGKAAVLTGVGQIIFTALVGFFIVRFLGYSVIHSAYISIGLTLSSTIVVLKLLADKGELSSLHGKIATGFLLIQDIFAAILLLSVSALSKNTGAVQFLIETSIKGLLVIVVLFFTAKYVLPHLAAFFARSQEFLFLFALAWGLGLATFLHYLGFSIEIGALAAGVMLSLSPYHLDISSKLRPLRDFFIILFFIFLGSQMSFGVISSLIYPAIILSLFVLVGNPLILMVITGLLGYRKRTSFLTGLTVAQVSEFSLILMLLGVKFGHVGVEELSLVTLVAIITIAGSSYLITYGEKIYPAFSSWLSVFERRRVKNNEEKAEWYQAVLFGYNRVGFDFLKVFKRMKIPYIVIDFDPEVVSKLEKNKIPYMYGDAGDAEFLESMDMHTVQMAVSTIPVFEVNRFLIKAVRKRSKDAVIMVISHNIDDAIRLYKEGASYVILPHFIGGQYGSHLIKKIGFNPERFARMKKKHLEYLAQRKEMGHEHPKKS